MATAARAGKWRAVAGLLVLTAANATAQYVPTTPGTERRESSTGAPLVGAGTPGVGTPVATTTTAGWTVTPSIELRETYTDNAFIGSETRRSDFITQVTPGIVIDGRSPRLIAHLSYAPSALFYARNGEANDVANALDAYGRLEAVEKFFYIEGLGNISQDFINPFAPQPGDITTVTQNRLETRTASLSPFIHSEGRFLEYELRNRNTWTNSDTEGLGKFRTRQWTGYVGQPVRRFGWTVEFDDTEISHYDALVNRPTDKARLYRGRLFYQPDPAWRLSVSAGSEENNYVLQQMQRTSIYGAGVAWRPSPRTSADFEYENRFFGPYRLARFTHRTRLTAWNVTYSRNTSTFQQEVLRLPPGSTAGLLDPIFAARFPNPDQRRAAVEEFMRASGTPAFLSNSLAFYTQRVYLREALEGSFALIGTRNSIAFTAFVGENSDIAADALGIVPDALLFTNNIKQRGFGAHAQHRLTPSTSIGANASRVYSRQVQPEDFPTTNDYLNVLLSYTAAPKTILYAGASISRFESENPLFVSNDDATSVFVGINHRF